jgi:hypothetical protein
VRVHSIRLDDRIGGMGQSYLTFDGHPLMRIPNEMKNCVVFAYRKDRRTGRFIPSGTAFLVGFFNFQYLITARHVIEKIELEGSDGLVHLRINKLHGDSELVGTKVSDWIFHPSDNTIDMAAIRFDPLISHDLRHFPLLQMDSVVTEELIAAKGIGVGDEVFIVGLYTNHHGKSRNLPIVRVGHIAAMPEERIDVKWEIRVGNTPTGPKWEKIESIEAYLVEARSIGGLSGSPVFVTTGRYDPQRLESGVIYPPLPPELRRSGPLYLLGIVHGHCKATVPDTDCDNSDEDVDANGKANAGLALVVPAQRIRDVLNHPSACAMREKERDEEQERTLPTPDSADD